MRWLPGDAGMGTKPSAKQPASCKAYIRRKGATRKKNKRNCLFFTRRNPERINVKRVRLVPC